MNNKNGNILKVGDYVSVKSRTIDGNKDINYGVLIRVDKIDYDAAAVVVSNNNGSPLPIACVLSSLSHISLPLDKIKNLEIVREIFHEMEKNLAYV